MIIGDEIIFFSIFFKIMKISPIIFDNSSE